MADYKNIKGFNIQYLDSDPPNPIEGQMWFNSTTQTLKGAEVGGAPAGTWSSGGNLNTGRYDSASASQSNATAALLFAGETFTPPTGALSTNVTESYNGTSWTELNDLSTAKQEAAGDGGAYGAFSAGGITTVAIATTEEWTAGTTNSTLTAS